MAPKLLPKKSPKRSKSPKKVENNQNNQNNQSNQNNPQNEVQIIPTQIDEVLNLIKTYKHYIDTFFIVIFNIF